MCESNAKILLCLGSNAGNREQVLTHALKEVCNHCTIVSKSPIYETPDDTSLGEPYLNVVVEATTIMPTHALEMVFKKIEAQFGRTAESKQSGVMPLDIDIIKFNDQILDPYQLQRPYFIKGLKMLPDYNRTISPKNSGW